MKTADIIPGNHYVIRSSSLKHVSEWDGPHTRRGLLYTLAPRTLADCLQYPSDPIVEVLECKNEIRCRLIAEGEAQVHQKMITDDGYVLSGHLETIDGEPICDLYHDEYVFTLPASALVAGAVTHQAEQLLRLARPSPDWMRDPGVVDALSNMRERQDDLKQRLRERFPRS
jgi:hypothetical protein